MIYNIVKILSFLPWPYQLSFFKYFLQKNQIAIKVGLINYCKQWFILYSDSKVASSYAKIDEICANFF